MIRRILLASLFFLVTICSCTNKKLDGIFDLKLGITESQLREIVDTSLLEEKDLIQKSKKHIITKENGFKVFYLDHYVSNDDYILEKITLSFFEDKLYKICICQYNSEIEKLLTADYGKPKIKKEENDKPRNKDSISTMYQYWNSNDRNILCWSSVNYYPNRSIFSYFLIIENRKIKEVINELLEKSNSLD